jgi:trehalose-6-phosphate synthase
MEMNENLVQEAMRSFESIHKMTSDTNSTSQTDKHQQNGNFGKVLWIGSLTGSVDPGEQFSLRNQLTHQHGFVPVFLDEKREDLFYNGFCKTVLWPLLHSTPRTAEEQISWQLTSSVDSNDYTHATAVGVGIGTYEDKMWQVDRCPQTHT